MKVHVYASYKRSPVGFHLGSFLYVKDRTENYTLSFCQESKIIYDIFEQDFIIKAFGRLPQSHNNLLLVKDLEYTYENHDELGKIVYVNIAFEISDPNEFLKFVSGYNSYDPSVLAKKMADFILPNGSNKEYGLVIDAERFNDFVNELLNKPISQIPVIEHFELVTKASDKTSFDKKITDIFNLTFERDGNKYYYPPKKKFRTSMNRTNHSQTDPSSAESATTLTRIFKIGIRILCYLAATAGIAAILFAFVKGLIFLFKRIF